MELVVIEKRLPIIEFNEVEVIEKLEQELAKYDGLVVTEEDEKGLKKTRAEMNKLKKQADDVRKEVKNELSKPITAFENKIKKVIHKIDEKIKPLDNGLKEIDQQRRDKKLEWVKEEIKKIAFEFGLNDKYASQIDIKPTWLTKSCVESKVTTEIKNVAEGLKLAQKTHEENKALIVESCQRLGESPVAWLELLENNYEISYIIRRVNEKYEQPTMDGAPKNEPKTAEQISGDATKEHVELIEDEVLTYSLKLTAPREKLITLRKIMNDMGIRYEKI